MSMAGALMQQQIEVLYSEHHVWLRRWLGKKLGNVQQAADLAHDTFMRLLVREEALTLQEPRAFLTTVAQRVLANHWRRQALERAYLEALEHLPQVSAPSAEERTTLLEILFEIDRRLDRLPIPVKRAFLLSQLDGLGHAQISETLGISVSTVKRYLIRAAHQCYFPDAVSVDV